MEVNGSEYFEVKTPTENLTKVGVFLPQKNAHTFAYTIRGFTVPGSLPMKP